MFGSAMRLRWSLLLLAGAALLVIQPSGLLQADRDQATCIQNCNALKELCRDACRADCAALYPVPSPQFDACNAACQEECSADAQECKFKCNVKKPPPHDAEP